MHIYRLVTGWLIVFLMQTASAQHLYVFSVISPNHRYQTDRDRLHRLADSLAFYGGYQQIRYDFSTQQTLDASLVRRTLLNFVPKRSENDLIWFHYAGRGRGEKPGVWPTLRLGTSELPVRDVLAILRNKNARTLLVTIDCANQPIPYGIYDTTIAGNRAPVSRTAVMPSLVRRSKRIRDDTLLTNRYRQLMSPVRIRQIIVMAASSHGQRAYRTNERGSVWLTLFGQVIQESVCSPDKTISWKQMNDQLSRLTQQKTGNRQTPLYNRQTITCCETDSLP